jgi:hypothetical protein
MEASRKIACGKTPTGPKHVKSGHMISRKESIRMELTAARDTFRRLLASLTDAGLQKQSRNPGWTNGEILAHMAFGFIVVRAFMPISRFHGLLPKGASKPLAWTLNALTGPFNWVNALGARGQGRVFTRERLPRIFDATYFVLLEQLHSVSEIELRKGMYFPHKWDPDFKEFMTLEEQFRYPVIHFNSHLHQIAR